MKIHIASDGSWNAREIAAYAWTSEENYAKKWTYWWITFDETTLTAAEYEVICNDVVVVPLSKLVKPAELFAQTGFIDDEPDPSDEFRFGGAAKLDSGIYAVNFYLTIGRTKHLLRGVRFKVADRKAKVGGGQIKTPLRD
jgi:hypothetical protein